MAGVQIVEVPIPESPGATGWELFAAVQEVDIATQVAGYGTPDLRRTAEEQLPNWRDPEQTAQLFAAVEDGRVVGRLGVWATCETPDTAFVELQVLPAEEGRGIGSLLDARLAELSRAARYTKLIAYAVSPDGPGERLVPPTGFGSVPRAGREVRFLVDRGWRLEQVERGSRLALPADPALLARLHAEATPHATGYRLHGWAGVTPEPFRTGMAELMERMTTDAPSAGLEEAPESWDAARVLEHETRLDGGPTTMLTTAAEHVESGRLAGMTRLRVPDDVTRPVFQWDTIVRREDRGHRLGMLLKLGNLAALQDGMPGHPSVLTWNAEENRPMLDVNEAIGFVPIGSEGAWRKDLPGSSTGEDQRTR